MFDFHPPGLRHTLGDAVQHRPRQNSPAGFDVTALHDEVVAVVPKDFFPILAHDNTTCAQPGNTRGSQSAEV